MPRIPRRELSVPESTTSDSAIEFKANARSHYAALRSRNKKLDRRATAFEAAAQELEIFLEKLARVQTLADARESVRRRPLLRTLGRQFYSNLEYLLKWLEVPPESNHEERAHYMELVKRWAAQKELEPAEAQAAIVQLRNSLR